MLLQKKLNEHTLSLCILNGVISWTFFGLSFKLVNEAQESPQSTQAEGILLSLSQAGKDGETNDDGAG